MKPVRLYKWGHYWVVTYWAARVKSWNTEEFPTFRDAIRFVNAVINELAFYARALKAQPSIHD